MAKGKRHAEMDKVTRMGRKRENPSGKGLLPRMEARRWADGKTVTYRYKPVGGKPINLGTDRMAALRQVLNLNQQGDSYGTLDWVWVEFQDSLRWKRYAKSTQEDYQDAWKQIQPRLGHMPASDITAPVLARYAHIERAEAPKRANTELALLSRLFGHGIKLGVCGSNPTLGVERHEMQPRTESPPEPVLVRFLSWLRQQTPQRQIIGMAAEYAAMAGNRQVEFLGLQWGEHVDMEQREVRVVRAKQRGQKRGRVVEVIHMSDRMYELFERLRLARYNRGRQSVWVFPNRGGNQYSPKGFATLWNRCVHAAMDARVLPPEQRFTFHDLRAFYTTQHKRQHGALPDLHANPQTTARVYDRSQEVPRDALE